MKKHPFVRRPLAVLAALAVGSTVLLGAAPAAQADDVFGQFIVQTDFSETGAAGCSLTSDTSNSFESGFEANGVAKAGSISSAATVEDAGDAADDTTMSSTSSGRVRATQSGGSLDTLQLTTSLSTQVVAAQGTASECDSTAHAMSGAQLYFTLEEGGWMTLRGNVKGGELQAQLSNAAMGEGTMVMSATIRYDQTRRVFLKPGLYVLLVIFEAEVVTPSAAGDPTTVVGGGAMNLDFTAAGDARGPAAGTGKAFVTLDGALSCGARSLGGRFTAKAAQVKTATFFVNGKRSKVVQAPRAGSDVVLRGLPASADSVVKAVLKLKAGGSRTVSRTYASCS